MTDLVARIRVTADGKLAITELGQVKAASAAVGATGAQAGTQIAAGFSRAGNAISDVTRQINPLNQLANAAGAVVAAFGARELIGYAETYKSIGSRIELATFGLVQQAAAQDRVQQIVRATGSAYAETGALVSTITKKQIESGQAAGAAFALASKQVTTLSQLSALSNTNAAGAAAAQTQLVQALQGGVLRAEELNSQFENAPAFIDALTRSLGVGTGELRRMAEAGQLTNEVVFGALSDQADRVAADFAKLPVSLARAGNALEASLTGYIGRADASLGATNALAKGILGLADNIESLDTVLAVGAAGFALYAGSRGIGGAVAAFNALAISGRAATTLTAATTVFNGVAAGAQRVAFSLPPMNTQLIGSAAAMATMRSAGAGLFALVGGWPTIIAAAGVALFALASNLTSVGDRAAAEARRARSELEATNAAFTAARAASRSANPERIVAEIAAVEQQLDRMRGRVSESSAAYQGMEGRLVALQAELGRAGAATSSFGGTQTGQRAAIDAFNKDLDSQVKKLREQIVAQSGGETAVAKYRAGQLSAAAATTEQKAKTGELIAELAKLETQYNAGAAASKSATAQIKKDGSEAKAAAEELARANESVVDSLRAANAELDPSRSKLEAYNRTIEDLTDLVGREGIEQTALEEAIKAVNAARAKAITEMERQKPAGEALIEQLEREVELSKLTAAQREAAERARAVRDAGGVVNDSEVQRLIAQRDANTEVARAAEEAAQRTEAAWDQAYEGMSRGIGDFVASGFKDFDSLVDSIKGSFSSLISDLVTQWAKANIFGSGDAGAGSFLQSIASLFGGGDGEKGSFLSSILGGGSGQEGEGSGLSRLLGGGGGGGGQAALIAAAAIFQAAVGGEIAAALGGNRRGAQIGALIGGIPGALIGGAFGSSFKPTGNTTQSINFSDTGVTGGGTAEFSRQRSFYRGTRTENRPTELAPETQQTINDVFTAIGAEVAAAAGRLGSSIPARISGSFISRFDKAGNVVEEAGTVLGIRYEESFERFAQRLTAENLVATVDAALGTTVAAAASSIAGAAGQALEDGIGGFGGRAAEGFEEFTRTVIKGIEGTQGEASAIAQRWRADAEQLLDGARFLVAAASDMRAGFNVLNDGTLTQITDLVESLAQSGEPLEAAYNRIAGSAVLLDEALALMGTSLDRSRVDVVTFATQIADAAGGLQAAAGLWDTYFNSFYSETERAARALEVAEQRRATTLAAIGLDAGISAEQFRTTFESILPTLTPAQVVQFLTAAGAISAAAAAQDRYNNSLAQSPAGAGGEEGNQALLDAIAGNASNALRGTTAQIAAFVESVAAEGEAVLAAYERINSGAGTLLSALALLGQGFTGTVDDFNRAASSLSGSTDFDSLFDEFYESFYSESERQATEAAQAQTALAQALAATGLAAEDLATREQIRAQIERALADGNIELAESLLRLAAATNRVASATSAATEAEIRYGQTRGNLFFGSGGGFGENGGLGNDLPGGLTLAGTAANGLATDFERIREGLRRWLDDLATGSLSPLTPAEQFAEAQRQFSEAAAAAAGDADAASRLSGLADTLLRQGQGFYGAGSAYSALFDQVRSVIAGIAGVSVTPIGGGGGGGGGGGDIRPIGGSGGVEGFTRAGNAAGSAAIGLERLASVLGLAPNALQAGLVATARDTIGALLEGYTGETRPPVTKGLDATVADISRLARAGLLEGFQGFTRPPVVKETPVGASSGSDELLRLIRAELQGIKVSIERGDKANADATRETAAVRPLNTARTF